MPRKSLHSSINNLSYKSLLIILFFLLISIVVLWKFVLPNHKVEASWWNDGWNYRKAVSISNTSGSNLTDFQISLSIGTSALIASGKMQSDCDDIRITDINGNLLPYWVEPTGPNSCNQTTDTRIWIKNSSIPTSGATIFIYYGNSSAPTASSGASTFIYFKNNFQTTDLSWNWSNGGVENGLAKTWANSYDSPGSTMTWLQNIVNITGQEVIAEFTVKLIKLTSTSHNTTNVVFNPTATTGLYTNTASSNIANSSGNSLITFGDYATWYGKVGFDSGYGQGNNITNDTNYPKYAFNTDGWVRHVHKLTNSSLLLSGYSLGGLDIGGSAWTYNEKTVTSGYTKPNTIILAIGEHTYDSTYLREVFVRKYTSVEPTATLQSEEAGGGPVAYWKFDEGNGTTAYDSTTNQNNGTFGTGSSAPTWADESQCISGKCLNFNGTSNYVDAGNNSSLKFGTGSFSVFTWVKFNSNSVSQYFINGKTIGNSRWHLYVDSSNVLAAFIDDSNGTSTKTTIGSYNTNQWYYLGFVRNKSTGKLYIYKNGVLVNSIDDTTNDITSQGVYLGAMSGSSSFFSGLLDEPKIYPYARTADQIKKDYNSRGSSKGTTSNLSSAASDSNLSDGLVSYWKMDEASGTASDSSGNGNTAPVVGLNNYGQGKFGNGFRSGIGSTNLTTNPSVETDNSGWSYWLNSGTGTAVRSTDTAKFGSYSYKSTMTADGNMGHEVGNISASPSTTYSVSGWVNITSWGGSNFTFYMREYYPTGNGQCGNTLYTASGVTNGWVRFSGTCTTRSDTTSLKVSYYLGSTSQIVYVDGIQIEKVSSQTPYTDGSLGIGNSWTSTAHASTSVRTTSSATTSLINDTSGTVAFWFNSPTLDNITSQCPLGSSNGDSTGGLFFALKNSGVFLTHVYGVGVSATSQYSSTINNNTWNHVTYTWDNASRTGILFVNGVQQQKITYSQAITIGEYLQNIGTCTKTGFTSFNGNLDEIRVYNRALSPTEVSALYNYAPDPVGYWDFEENTGTVAKDKSGNNNNGTLVSSPTWTQGKIGSALNFNGTNNYVNAGNAQSLNPSYAETISAWVKLDTIPANQSSAYPQILGKRDVDTQRAYFFSFEKSSSKLYWELKDSSGTYYTLNSIKTNWNANEWYYVTAVFDGSSTSNNSKIFVNGILDNQTTWNLNYVPQTSATTRIGGGSSYYLDGSLDEVKLYNYARTQKQIIEDMNGSHPAVSNKSMVGYWKFDEGSGTTTNNSGNGGSTFNTTFATGSSAPTWTNDGKFGKALNFDGVGNYALTNSDPANNLQEMTISTWVKPDSVDKTGPIVGNVFGWYYRYGIFISGGTYTALFRSTGGTWSLSSSVSSSPNNWDYVAVSYKDGTAKIYVNGKLRNSGTFTYAPLTQGSSTIMFGTHSVSANDWFKGSIDEVKIYNYALTDDEIKKDYNQGSALQMGQTSQTIGGTTTSLEYCIPGDTSYCASPVAELNFEENTGTTTKDSSGNNNTGTFGTGSSAPTWTVGKKNTGAGVKFDGVNDYLTVPNYFNLSPATLEFWFKANSWSNNPVVIGKDSAGPNNGYIQSTGTLKFYAPGNIATVNWGTPSLNTWHHATLVITGSQHLAYLDGIAVGSTVSSSLALFTGNYNFKIGCYDGGTYAFNGSIDGVKIYNYARTPAQVAYDYNKGAPIGWWKFDECQGSTAYDSSGFGNNGAISIGTSGSQNSLGTCQIGTSAAWTNGASGHTNSSLNFDGSDDAIIFGKKTGLNGVFTASAWFKRKGSSGGGYHGIINSITGDTTYTRILVNDGGNTVILQQRDSTGSIIAGTWSNQPFGDNNWHHIVYLFDGSFIKLYTDGKLQGSPYACNGITSGSNVLEIGRGQSNSYFSNGQIDDVQIYNYALTPEQIKTLYNGGAVSFN